jgi:hypothetical protein
MTQPPLKGFPLPMKNHGSRIPQQAPRAASSLYPRHFQENRKKKSRERRIFYPVILNDYKK